MNSHKTLIKNTDTRFSITDLYQFIQKGTLHQRLEALRIYLEQIKKRKIHKTFTQINLFDVKDYFLRAISQVTSFDEWKQIVNDVLNIPSNIDFISELRTAILDKLSSKTLRLPPSSKKFLSFMNDKILRYPQDIDFLLTLFNIGFEQYFEKSKTLRSVRELGQALDQMLFLEGEARKKLKERVKLNEQSLNIQFSKNDPILVGEMNPKSAPIGPKKNQPIYYNPFHWGIDLLP